MRRSCTLRHAADAKLVHAYSVLRKEIYRRFILHKRPRTVKSLRSSLTFEMSRRYDQNDDYFGLPHPWGKVVVITAVVGASYAALSYFNKDKDVGDSLESFGNNVRADARGLDKDLRSHGRDFRARADDKARDLGFR